MTHAMPNGQNAQLSGGNWNGPRSPMTAVPEFILTDTL
jgi:hypothetical protein